MKTSTHKNRKYLFIFGLIIFFIVLLGGVAGTLYISSNTDETVRNYLQSRARNISVVLDQQDLKSLTGTVADLANPGYARIKDILTSLSEANPDIRFIYLMGLRDGQQFFYVDSENPSSKDYSVPGSAYTEATPTDLYNHSHGIIYTSGPYKDEWGTWVSAYAPIIDRDTGAVLALVGLDTDAHHLLTRLSHVRLEGFLITGILSLLILSFLFIVRKSNRFSDQLEEMNADLMLNKQYLLEVEDIANMGHFTWDKEKNELHINQVLMDFLSTTQSVISGDYYNGHMNEEDIVRIRQQMAQMTPGTSFITFKYHLTNDKVKDRPVLSVCKIKRNIEGEVIGAVGTVQDSTNQ